VAIKGPEILCHTEEIALGTAVSGEKWAVASAAAKFSERIKDLLFSNAWNYHVWDGVNVICRRV
jgi:hypothetical protein